MNRLHLTSKTLDNLQEIYDYSVDKWDEKAAQKYIQYFEETFSLLKENKGLLKINKAISSRFKVYFVKKHCLICDIIADTIFVLTIKHTSLNILERLKELEPNLEEEVKILHKRISKS